jgi:acetyl esterase
MLMNLRAHAAAVSAMILGLSLSPMNAADDTTPETRAPVAPLGQERIYKQIDGQDLKVYVSTPPGWTAEGKAPAILLFHGGGWQRGTPRVLNDQAEFLQSKGFVVFLVQYRLAGDKGPPEECLRDAKSAMRWVRKHASEWGVDPDRIAAGGGSAGAHLAAGAAMLPGFDDAGEDVSISCKPNALILFNPVIDNGPEGYGYKRFAKRYQEFSPAHNIAPGAPPTLILSGTADVTAKAPLLQRFAEAMTAAGNRCDLKLYEGGKHGFYRKSDSNGKYFGPTLSEVESFFRSLGWLS